MVFEGTVVFFDPHRGFGFIRPRYGAEDLFFHCSELPGERGKRFVNVGGYVQYELGTRQGKAVAKNVKLLVDPLAAILGGHASKPAAVQG